MKRLLLTSIFAVTVPLHLHAQDADGWVVTEGRALIENITPEQARLAALNEARAEAVRRVAGVNIKSENLSVRSETMRDQKSMALQEFFATVNRDVAYGHVVKEEILEERTTAYDLEPGLRPQLYYCVKLRAQVELARGAPDPAFGVHVKTNKALYEEHEIMTIDLRATKTCHLYVFNLTANDSLIVLFPNLVLQNNRLPADSTLRLMPEGLDLEVTLLPGMARASELIYVVATKQRFEFAPEWRDRKRAGFRTVASPAFAVIELPRWLANIPLEQRTDCTVSYEVYKAGKR